MGWQIGTDGWHLLTQNLCYATHNIIASTIKDLKYFGWIKDWDCSQRSLNLAGGGGGGGGRETESVSERPRKFGNESKVEGWRNYYIKTQTTQTIDSILTLRMCSSTEVMIYDLLELETKSGLEGFVWCNTY
jgi:hypothetical protein